MFAVCKESACAKVFIIEHSNGALAYWGRHRPRRGGGEELRDPSSQKAILRPDR